MDTKIKMYINAFFTEHYKHIYPSKPEIKSVENTNYYYTQHPESNIVCLIPEQNLNQGTFL
jgi:hypothetical protein